MCTFFTSAFQVMKRLRTREAFLWPVNLPILPHMLKLYDFSFFLERSTLAFTMAKPSTKPSWESLYRPLRIDVWGLIVVTVVVVYFVLLMAPLIVSQSLMLRNGTPAFSWMYSEVHKLSHPPYGQARRQHFGFSGAAHGHVAELVGHDVAQNLAILVVILHVFLIVVNPGNFFLVPTVSIWVDLPGWRIICDTPSACFMLSLAVEAGQSPVKSVNRMVYKTLPCGNLMCRGKGDQCNSLL
ncbi:hypothetical protein E2C01_079287 [Portunus trituberculatus]|uniref:Uncharacterized protein n=1 Tax=Portunus trituberculatus TaxID=210409 RepID=A0A5B7ISX9_PORTR|nr:hypothetical protein [Portunus trituberculatus]